MYNGFHTEYSEYTIKMPIFFIYRNDSSHTIYRELFVCHFKLNITKSEAEYDIVKPVYDAINDSYADWTHIILPTYVSDYYLRGKVENWIYGVINHEHKQFDCDKYALPNTMEDLIRAANPQRIPRKKEELKIEAEPEPPHVPMTAMGIKDTDTVPEIATCTDIITERACGNTNPKTFDFVRVIYGIARTRNTKETHQFVKNHLKEFIELAYRDMKKRRCSPMKKYANLINWLKLSDIQIGKDATVEFLFELKEIKE